MARRRLVVAVLCVFGLLAVACGSEGDGDGPDDRPTPAPTPSEAVMRLAYASEPPTLDPLGSGGGSAATRDILRPLLPALFRLDANLRPQPDLVAAWPSVSDVAQDPFTVTLRLRQATWSDGKPITSADVRFTWEKLREGPHRHRYRFLTDVQAPDATTVRLVFDRPVRRWWSLFSIDDMVLPAHAYTSAWKDAPTVSGGPFRFEEWTPGLRVRLVRNDSYGTTVPLKGIDVLFVPSDETRLQLLDRGEVDLAFFEGESNVGRRAQAYGFAAVDGPLQGSAGASSVMGPTWWELDMDPGRLGGALARTIRDSTPSGLLAEMLEDSGEPMEGIDNDFTDRVVPDGPWPLRDGTDPAPGGGAFQLAYGGSAAGALASLLHFRLRDAGVTAELVGVESDTFEGTVLPQRTTPAVIRLRRGADAPDTAAFGVEQLADELTAAETAGMAGIDDAGRLTGLDGAGWLRVEQALADAATVVPLVAVRTVLAGAPGVIGPQAVGASNGPLWNAGTWQIDR